MISSSLLMVGCGGGGSDPISDAIDRAIDNNTSDAGASNSDDGGTNSGATDTQNNRYSGNSLIHGAIALSSLLGQDGSLLGSTQAQPKRPVMSVRSTFGQPREAAPTADNAVVKLFAVTSGGDLEDTGIACKFLPEKDQNGDPKYSCEGVKDGNTYVVKYVRLLEDNRAIEMKVNVDLPEGSTEAAAEEISPQSTVVVDAIVKAVLTATEGKDIDEDVIKDIVISVKETVEALIETGTVQIPSMVVEAPKDEQGNYITSAAELVKGRKVEFASNDELDEVSGVLVANENVARQVDAAKVEIEVRELKKIDVSDEKGKKALIAKIFAKLLGDDDVPGYIVEFFTNQYVAGKQVALGDLFNAVHNSLKIDPALGVTLDDLGLSGEDAAAKLADTLDEIYDLQEKRAAGNLTEGEKEKLAKIPGIITVAFPANEWRDREVLPATTLNVPQGIVFTIFVTDKYVPAAFKEATDKDFKPIMEVKQEEGDQADQANRPKEVHFRPPVDFDPMHFDPDGNKPGLLQFLGFFEEQNLQALHGMEIGFVDVMPERIHVADGATPDKGKAYDALRAKACVTDLAAFAQKYASESRGGIDATAYSAELTYPRADGGSKTISLVGESELFDQDGSQEDRDGGEICFVLDPRAQANKSGGTLSEADFITDFVSGEYKVVVTGPSGVAERTVKRKMFTGMLKAVPTLQTPPAQGPKVFPMNHDRDGDGNKDSAMVTIKWARPDISLPKGVKIGYAVDIFRDEGCDESGCHGSSIYSSKEKNHRFWGRALKVPTPLDKLEVDEGIYRVNVCAEFVDTETGRFIGQGGCSYAEFNVGEPLDPHKTFDIYGDAKGIENPAWKVALIGTRAVWGNAAPKQRPILDTITVGNIDYGKYGLFPKIGDFLSRDADGKPLYTAFDIVLFHDVDGNDKVDFPAAGKPGEPVFWPAWDKRIRFETWGDVLRVIKEQGNSGPDGGKPKEQVIVGNETVDGPDFSLAELPVSEAESAGTSQDDAATQDSQSGNGESDSGDQGTDSGGSDGTDTSSSESPDTTDGSADGSTTGDDVQGGNASGTDTAGSETSSSAG